MKLKAGLSQQIRSIARERYVLPALKSGCNEFPIHVRDLIDEARAQGVRTDQRTPQFCTSIQKEEFLRDNDLEIIGIDGPPSKLSTTVVIHYRRIPSSSTPQTEARNGRPAENSREKAVRLAEKLRGVLKDELAEYGGGEAFLRWIRSEEKEEA